LSYVLDKEKNTLNISNDKIFEEDIVAK